MKLETEQSLKVEIIIEPRPDGGIRVHSADVPGLVLSGADAKAVIADVLPALETLLSEQMGCQMRATWLLPYHRAPAPASARRHAPRPATMFGGADFSRKRRFELAAACG